MDAPATEETTMSAHAPEILIWLERWMSLKNRITDLQQTLINWESCISQPDVQDIRGKGRDCPNLSPVSRAGVFLQVLECLSEFGEQQFQFFFEGFKDGSSENGNGSVKLEHSDDFPTEHVMYVTLEQIAYDLAVIQRAISQRILGTKKEKDALVIADWLGLKALEPVKGCLIKEDDFPIVVTYFQKEASIRVIPYAKLALVAVPFTAVDIPVDYLAIPHEVGHYVYWHLQQIQAPFLQMPKDKTGYDEFLHPAYAYRPVQSSVVYNWQEEIFADVYGCLIAGPVIALEFQDLQLQKDKEQFTGDDGEHPSPIIRPRVYTQVLHASSNPEWNKWAKVLDARWDELRRNRSEYAEEFTPRFAPDKFFLKAFSTSQKDKPIGAGDKRDVKKNLNALNSFSLARTVRHSELKELTEAIKSVLEILKGVKGSPDWLQYLTGMASPALPSISAPLDHQKFKDIYTGFKQNVEGKHKPAELTRLRSDLAANDGPSTSTTSSAELYQSGSEPSICVTKNLQKEWHDKGKLKGSQPTWRHVLKADGWTTRGPDGRFDPE